MTLTILTASMLVVQCLIVGGLALLAFKGRPQENTPAKLDFEAPPAPSPKLDVADEEPTTESEVPVAPEPPRKTLEATALDGLWYARQLNQHGTDAQAVSAAIAYVEVIDLRADGRRDWPSAAIGAAVRSQLAQAKANGSWT